QISNLVQHQEPITNIAFTFWNDALVSAAGSEIKITDISTRQCLKLIGNKFSIKDLVVGQSFWGPVIAAVGKKKTQQAQKPETEICFWHQPKIGLKAQLYYALQQKNFSDVLIV